VAKQVNIKINQLKEDLDLLLNFNENLLHFSSSIVSSAVSSKVKDFFRSVTNSLDDSDSFSEDTETKEKSKMIAATSILSVTEDISDRLASTVEPGSSLNITSDNVALTLMKRRPRNTGNSEWDGEGGNCSVRLPDQDPIVGKDSSITVSFTQYYKLGESLNHIETEEVSTAVVGVHVVQKQRRYGRANGHNSVKLVKPVEFTLQHKQSSTGSPRCVFWDFSSSSWSGDGCYIVSAKKTSTTCKCFHLTNFAVLLPKEKIKPSTVPTPMLVTWSPLTFYSSEPSVKVRKQNKGHLPEYYTAPSLPWVVSESPNSIVIASASPQVFRKPRYKRKFIPRNEEEEKQEEFRVLTQPENTNKFRNLTTLAESNISLMTTSPVFLDTESPIESRTFGTDDHTESDNLEEENDKEEPIVLKVDVTMKKDIIIIIAMATITCVIVVGSGLLICCRWKKKEKESKPQPPVEGKFKDSSWYHFISRKSDSRSDTSSLCSSSPSTYSEISSPSSDGLNNFQNDVFLSSLEDDISVF